jgi:hypothetical protein
MRAMSEASVSVPVAVPVASIRARWVELVAGLAVSMKPLLGCISKVAMAGPWEKRTAGAALNGTNSTCVVLPYEGQIRQQQL